MSLQSLVYLYHELYNQQKINKEEWNFVGELENFKIKCNKSIEQVCMAEYQIKINNNNINNVLGVYYCPKDQ